MLRQRVNFSAGTSSGVISDVNQTTITGGVGSTWPIPSGNNGTYYIPVVLNPGYFGSATTPEIVYVTTVTGNVATVLRAREGTVTISGASMPWTAGPTTYDFDVTNLTSTGTLTLNNGLTANGAVAGQGTTSIYAPNGGLSVASGLYAGGTGNYALSIPNGGANIGGNVTVSGNIAASGNLTVGSYTTGNILPYTTPGGAPANNALLQYSTYYNNWVPVNSLTVGSNSATFPLTTVSNFLTGSNLGPAANTIANVTSISLTAGVWMITACCLIENTASTIGYATLFLGPNSNSTIGAYASSSKTIGNATGAEYYVTMNINALVTLASTTTVYLNIDLANGSGPYVIYVNSLVGSIPNATGITAVKIG